MWDQLCGDTATAARGDDATGDDATGDDATMDVSDDNATARQRALVLLCQKKAGQIILFTLFQKSKVQ